MIHSTLRVSWKLILSAMVLALAVGILWRGDENLVQGAEKGEAGTFRHLDNFQKTLPPGKIPGKWKANYHLPVFGSGEKALIQFVHKSASEHYIHLASGKNNWFSLGMDLPFNLKDWPVLEWEWKITKLPKGGDVRIPEKDDQAGAICLITGLGTFGFDSALCYLYENAGPKNTLVIHPKNKNSRFYFLRTGEADGVGQWFKERRNIVQDYKKAFGDFPKSKALVVIQIDSNTTETSAEAYYRNIFQRKR